MKPSERWGKERVALASEGLRASGFLRLRVHGESMLPTLVPGDVVEIASCAIEEVRAGEIVLARREERFYLHRFVARRGDGFVLRGDSMPRRDPMFHARDLLGKVARVDPSTKARTAAFKSRFWHRPLGILCCYSGAVRAAILKFRRPRPQPDALPNTA